LREYYHITSGKKRAISVAFFPVSWDFRFMLLKDKVLVVIGGTSGIGLAAVQAFLREGASVVATGSTPEKCEAVAHDLGDQPVRVLARDAAESGSTEEVIVHAVKEFGPLSGLFHVAGGSGRKHGDGPLHEITDDGWEKTLQWNLSSIFYSNRAAVRQFLEQGSGGSILNTGSTLGFSPSPQYFSTHAYAATKSAIIGFTQSTAAYYARENIRLNVLAPALVDTPMARRAAENPEITEFIRHKQPLDGGRIGYPDDCAGAAVYFLSDHARFVTGQVLAVDGGWSVSDVSRGFAENYQPGASD
jgi:NAD(P)-dependent dehydrogenase (short-subunit alcohol dehydrogenase family)